MTKALLLKKQRAIWMMTPRVCSTAIKWAFAEFLGISLRDGNVHRTDLGYIPCNRIARYPDHWVFSIMRDPRDRLLSAFCDPNGHSKAGSHGVTDSTTWPEFVRLICATPSETLDIHTRPQLLLLSVDGKVRPDFIGRYETLAESWRVIADRIGCSPILQHLHKTTHKPFREHYAQDEWDMVTEKYLGDVELGGYSVEREANASRP